MPNMKISEKTRSQLFELKCAWRLKTFDETIQKLIRKAIKEVTVVGEQKPKKEA